MERALSALPKDIASNIAANASRFEADMDAIPAEEAQYQILVDKRHPLPDGYAPTDLISLNETGLSVSRKDLSLRKAALKAAKAMAAAAQANGVTLVFSSSYRSYAYQKQLFARYANEMGEAEANRVSARPGQSQHQLGTAIDFGSITNDFSETKAGRWMAAHSAQYGFTLSFPRGMESVTGYNWESWHFRYVGVKAAALQEKWFNGVQQYMIEFLDLYRAN
jgi:D-alanyl-D-alanine carboxypeptidase